MSFTAALVVIAGIAGIALLAGAFVWLRRKMNRIYDGLE
jgi:hypothetical protein